MQGASNAILALSRALYGKRITKEQYTDLISCKNCNEIAAYLRSNTVYESAFEGSLKSEFTAQALCDTVKKCTFSNFMYLYRYEVATGQKFSKYFIAKNEVEQILKCTMLILTGKSEEYMLSFEGFLDKYLTINLFEMAKANTLEEVATALKRTKYAKLYQECVKKSNVTYLDFETAFNGFFEQYQQKLIDDCFSKDEKKNMVNLISRNLDLEFIKKICRIIKFYDNNEELKKSVGALKLTLLTKKQIKALINCESLDQVRQVLQTSAYRKVSQFNESNIGFEFETYLHSIYKKRLRFSNYPAEIMFSYMYLAESECRNIIKIIEGCKYKVSPELMRECLIAAE